MQHLIKLLLIIVISAVAFFILKDFSLSESEHDDDEAGEIEENEEEELVFTVDGNKAIKLDDDYIETFGLELAKIESANYKSEDVLYARVVNVNPILTLHADYKELNARLSGARTSLVHQNNLLRKAEKLNQAKSLSTRELELIRAQRSEVNAEVKTLEAQLENKSLTIQSEWGAVLAGHIKNGTDMFQRLVNHQLSLVFVALPRDIQLDSLSDEIFIAAVPERELAKNAEYLGLSNLRKNNLLGEGHLFMLEAKRLSPDMRMFAWLKSKQKTLAGVFIPDSAIIWYANSPWFYINEDELFIRIKLENAQKTEKGWILFDKTYENQALVVKGGQSLFSQEFKWAIPDEDDD